MTGNICLFSEQYDLFISLKCGPHIVTEFASCLFTWGSLEFQWFNHRWHSDQTTLYECTYRQKESSRIILWPRERCKQRSSRRLPCGALGGKHTLPNSFTFPRTLLPHLPFQAASKREREIWGPRLEEMGFIVLPLLLPGGYCLLPKPGFLRKVGGEKRKGASRSSRKIEKKEVVLQKPYFLIYMIRWQMNWVRLKTCFLETFNVNFILKKKKGPTRVNFL